MWYRVTGVASYKEYYRFGSYCLKTEANIASETCCLCVLKYLFVYGEGTGDDDCVCVCVCVCVHKYKGKCKYKMIPLQPGVAQRVGRGITLLFHDHGTRRG